MAWGEIAFKLAKWTAKYLLRERRTIKATTLSYPLVSVNPAWQKDLVVSYQGTPITGFYYYSIKIRNTGTRSVQNFPATFTVAPNCIVAWPLSQPADCLKNMKSVTPNQFAAEIDFINPREEVGVFFWTFNDRTGSVIVTGRAPDVEFAVEPWKPTIDTATTIGIKLHYVVFWIGAIVVLSLIGVGVYKLAWYFINLVNFAMFT